MKPPAVTRRQLAFAAGVVGLFVIAGVASNSAQFAPGEQRPPVRAVLPIEQNMTNSDSGTRTVPSTVELPQTVVVACAVVMALAVLYLLSRQRFSIRFRRPSVRLTTTRNATFSEEEHADTVAEFTRDLIDELREGDSPRIAIQRAYAAVETGFGAKDLARKKAETPTRYMQRIFGQHASIAEPLRQLTSLFQQARFSHDAVTEASRDEAIAALAAIRMHYTKSAWRQIERLEGAS